MSKNISSTVANTMSALAVVPDEWDDDDATWTLKIDNDPSKDSSLVQPISVTILPKKKEYKNHYSIYPYFMAGLEGTVFREMFPFSEYPLADLKKTLEMQGGLVQYISTVRSYVKSLFYVLKSTKYYNPIVKSRVPLKKGDIIDQKLLSSVKNEDRIKVYRLFGFQGHLGPKKINDDVKRDELLEKLKNIMYDTTTLTIFVVLLMQRLFIDIDEEIIRNACIELKRMTDYEYKSYQLSDKWYHDAKWQKLRYVYGEGLIDNIGGGCGGITREMGCAMKKATSFQK